MKTIKETLELALEALTDSTVSPTAFATWSGYHAARVNRDLAITALREALSSEALDKMAENARELGLDYEPSTGTQVSKVWWDGERLMAKRIPFVGFYKPVQQEPVAWMTQARNFVHLCEFTEEEAKLYGWSAVYTSPPTLSLAQRKPLTDDEMWSLWNSQGDDAMEQMAAIAFARDIEAAHGITAAPQLKENA